MRIGVFVKFYMFFSMLSLSLCLLFSHFSFVPIQYNDQEDKLLFVSIHFRHFIDVELYNLKVMIMIVDRLKKKEKRKKSEAFTYFH